MSGGTASPKQPAGSPEDPPVVKEGKLNSIAWAAIGALSLLLLGSLYNVFGWGLESWVREVIRRDVQIQEMLKITKENRDRAQDMEKIMIQIQADQKAQSEFLIRLLDRPAPSGASGS